MSLSDTERETAKRLWNEGRSAASIARFLDGERSNQGEITRIAIIRIIQAARERDPSIRVADPNEHSIAVRIARRRKSQQKYADGMYRPPIVHDKKSETQPRRVSGGEVADEDAAVSDRQHLFRAHGQRDIPFIDRSYDECAWPGWSNADRIGTVCGLPTVIEPHVRNPDGSPRRLAWCKFHHEIATTGQFGSMPYRIK